MLKLIEPGKRRNKFWYVSGRHGGTRHEVSTGTTDRSVAEVFLQRFTEALDGQTESARRAEPEHMPLGEFERWMLKTLFVHGDLIVSRETGREINFHNNGAGYRTAKIPFGPWDKRVLEHRVRFLLAYGWLPRSIDHIDGDGHNNALSNLRAATPAMQTSNIRDRRDSRGNEGITP